jgi:ATP adenylyltransferase/5',5'''-P-1,P-4-tetraphosphate phosphorylase II
VFTSFAESKKYIEKLHEKNTAYNLLYTPGCLYCFPRKMQGEYQHASWTPGFSWYELCGGILTANHDSFKVITSTDIENEFNLL